MARRKYRTNLSRVRDNDWKEGLKGMDDEELKSTHSTKGKVLNGIKIGQSMNGVVRYMLYNRKGEPLRLEILHLLHNEEFVLKKGRRIEALNDGYGLLRKWREKGTINCEGHIADVKSDMLLMGDKIKI